MALGGYHIRVSRCKNKESWQWGYLLAKKLFSDDVLTICVRRLGHTTEGRPWTAWHMKQPWLMPAAIREAALVLWAWDVTGWFAGDGLGTQLSGQQHRPCSCWSHPPAGWQLQSGGCCLPWTAHDSPELLRDPWNLLISWNLTLWHLKIGSNFCGKSHV